MLPATRRVGSTIGIALAIAPVACGSGNKGTVLDFSDASRRDSGTSEAGLLHGGSGCGTGVTDAGCACTPGQTRSCYTGPAGTLGVGACKAGVQTCVTSREAQVVYGACEGEVVPSATNGGCISEAGAPHDSSVLPDARSGRDAQVGGEAVLFAGVDNAGMLADTWTFNGAAWTQVNVTGPSGAAGRGNAVMAPLDGLLVLFGGFNYGSSGTGAYYSDTWAWNGTAWTQVNVAGPPGRCDSMMAPLGGKLVLFGGFSANGSSFTNYGDTWTFDGSAWTQLNVTGPSGRDQAVMAPLGGKLVLFGGVGGANTDLGDTWTFDGTTWNELSVTGPSARTYSVMQPLDGKLVMFGGLVQGTGGHNSPLSDTWTWDGSAWTQLNVTGPSARSVAVMTPLDGKLVLFGGEDVNGTALSDTWTWDGNAWAQVNVSGPPGRYWSVMATP